MVSGTVGCVSLIICMKSMNGNGARQNFSTTNDDDDDDDDDMRKHAAAYRLKEASIV